MQIRVHRESAPGERRVALVPRDAAQLIADGHGVVLPEGCGAAAGYPDPAYVEAGATTFGGPPDKVDLVVGIGPLSSTDVHGAGCLIAFLDPLGDPENINALAATGVTAFAMELIPRTTLAQAMDALSSQATAAGYQAVLLAAEALPRFFPMMMTAAGTIRPSKVLVLGAGVAGLQAIATARRLGAIVSGYDIRPAAREQVESLGARFVSGPVADSAEVSGGYAAEVDESMRQAQLEALSAAVAESDVVITTAQVPGRKAPLLVTADMIAAMKAGSVIVDLAVATGGNCEGSRPGEVVDSNGVSIHGPLDLASRAAGDASSMYSRNVYSLIHHLAAEGTIAFDPDDEISAAACVVAEGRIVNEAVAAALAGAS
jgi:NAD(P) transhydrogenase subunit alpha